MCNDEEIEFCIYSSSVTMLYSDGKNTVRQVDFTVNETHIRFTKELWSRYSNIVLAKHLALFDDWLLGISTPNSDKTTLACFA
ncbi:hypothetical protein [Lysinibacillus sp. NPDC047702]|uniref:hypothetical protein n=1 Tax=unclassified Lysinibacillus TaxID=2636778 RepID=UPI003CFBC5BB